MMFQHTMLVTVVHSEHLYVGDYPRTQLLTLESGWPSGKEGEVSENEA